jgi:hypothetical protein
LASIFFIQRNLQSLSCQTAPAEVTKFVPVADLLIPGQLRRLKKPHD